MSLVSELFGAKLSIVANKIDLSCIFFVLDIYIAIAIINLSDRKSVV